MTMQIVHTLKNGNDNIQLSSKWVGFHYNISKIGLEMVCRGALSISALVTQHTCSYSMKFCLLLIARCYNSVQILSP